MQKSTKWVNATHLGAEYAALMVEPGYRPPRSLHALPETGGGVLAVARVRGAAASPSPSLQFSGYEWRIRTAPSSRGGSNRYAASNAWTDDHGALHLRIAKDGDSWTCAGVSLSRSLGYGAYSFVVRDTSQLEPSVVFGMFSFDYSGADENFHEFATEMSRWGHPASKNGQYVIQPYYIPANVQRFAAPAGVLTHSYRWESGRLTFQTVRGANGQAAPVAGHVFTSGVPAPGIESVRMNLYIMHTAKTVFTRDAEVVVEKFEYLP